MKNSEWIGQPVTFTSTTSARALTAFSAFWTQEPHFIPKTSKAKDSRDVFDVAEISISSLVGGVFVTVASSPTDWRASLKTLAAASVLLGDKLSCTSTRADSDNRFTLTSVTAGHGTVWRAFSAFWTHEPHFMPNTSISKAWVPLASCLASCLACSGPWESSILAGWICRSSPSTAFCTMALTSSIRSGPRSTESTATSNQPAPGGRSSTVAEMGRSSCWRAASTFRTQDLQCIPWISKDNLGRALGIGLEFRSGLAICFISDMATRRCGDAGNRNGCGRQTSSYCDLRDFSQIREEWSAQDKARDD